MRQMELRGDDLKTNSPVQYGLINWILGVCPMLKPNTRFLTHYLAAVGSLQTVARDVDLRVATVEMLEGMPDAEAKSVFRSKETLLLRPLGRLFADPHALAGFFGLYDGDLWKLDGDTACFTANPLRFLADLYHYLHMDYAPGKPASEMIWEHDHEHLEAATAFYDEVACRTGTDDWDETRRLLEGDASDAISGGDAELFEHCASAHRGFQLGLEILLLIPRIALRSGFSEISVGEDLEPHFPDQFQDAEIAKKLTRALAPPPKASSDEIVSPSGGTYYAREAPHLPPLIGASEHFEEGQPLFIIEVMKMFNKVFAPCAGTVVENRMADADGSIVRAGQTIFKIQPDEVAVEESEADVRERREAVTRGLLA
jgi:biotin carboxyl carrier protein